MLIRKATKEELPFVYSTWLKSYKHSSQFAARIKNNVYYNYHQQIVKRLVSRSEVLVASESEDGPVFGYIVFESPNLIHFAYIKKSFRHLGLFKELLKESKLNLDQCGFTHWTKAVDKIVDLNPNILYIPYLV